MFKKQQVISFGFIIFLLGLPLIGMEISPEQKEVHEKFKTVIYNVLVKEKSLLAEIAETSSLIQRCMVLHNKLTQLNLQGIHFPMQLDVIKRIFDSCAICSRLFQENDIIIFSDLDTSCPHLYHSDCILHMQQYHRAFCRFCNKGIFYAPQKLLLVDMKIGQKELEQLYQKFVCKHRDIGHQRNLLNFRQNTIGLTALISSVFFLTFKHAGWSNKNIVEFIFCQSFLVMLESWSLLSIDKLLYERLDLLKIKDPLLSTLFFTIICSNTYDRFLPGSEFILGTLMLAIIGQASLRIVSFSSKIIEHYQEMYWRLCVDYFKDPIYFNLFPIEKKFMEQCYRFIED